jgi:hypothetical protein
MKYIVAFVLIIAHMGLADEHLNKHHFNPMSFTNSCGDILVDKEMVENVNEMEDMDNQEKYLVGTAKKDIAESLKRDTPSKYREECLKKTTAIRLLGKIHGVNHVDVLIDELSFSDPNIKKGQKYPAIDALIDKGRNAENALWCFLENAELSMLIKNYNDNEEKIERILQAIWALKAINSNEAKFYDELEQRKHKIDRQIYIQLMARSGGLYNR